MFWKEKTLDTMTPAEWESLCDGCGKCCLHRVQDADSGAYYDTDVACILLDTQTARCMDYDNRKKTVPDCVKLTAKITPTLQWLPDTCAYRLLSEGKELHDWHPLVSGDTQSVHTAGISVRNAVVSERDVDDLNAHIEAYFNCLIQ